ncbi:HAD-like domain [Macleaya cordata]|uniref:HAD-like domain n=2 Tax=Magnoliopsida TaxID=3398 RepID=A0A200R4G5_MACCD|nr:HAD-like domain [Macleaya cordata]
MASAATSAFSSPSTTNLIRTASPSTTLFSLTKISITKPPCRESSFSSSLRGRSISKQQRSITTPLNKRKGVICSASSTLHSALLFDCDGVLVDTEKDGHRISFNDTFAERELGVTWDVDLYGELLKIGGGKERMTAYFNKTGWPEKAPKSEEERKEFIASLHKRKTELFMVLIEKKLLPLRPGVAKLIDQALAKGVKVAVCSTSNEKAVSAIVSCLLGPKRAEKIQIFAGDVVPRKKPDPAIYILAASTLGVEPSSCVVVEDSAIGLAAAKAAGMKCIVTKSGYTADEDFLQADAVFDCIGDPPEERFDLAFCSSLLEKHRTAPADIQFIKHCYVTGLGSRNGTPSRTKNLPSLRTMGPTFGCPDLGSSAWESTASKPYTVFVDTNLDTHLVTIGSDEDTVRDLKQKIMSEHLHCFPKIGEITIQAMKVRRKGCFYHISDSMLVKSAFDGVNRTWFLYIDAASSQVVPTENRSLPNCFRIMDGTSAETGKNNFQLDHQSKRVSTLDGSSDIMNQLIASEGQFVPGDMGGEVSAGLNLGRKSLSLEQNKTSSGTNKRTVSGKMKRHDPISNENEVPGTHTEQKKDESGKVREMQFDEILGEAEQLEPAKKKQRKENKIEDDFSYSVKDPSKGSEAGICVSSKETSKPDNLVPKNSSGEALQAELVAKKKHTNEKKIEDSFFDPSKDTMGENDSGTCLHSKVTSKPEMSQGNSLEDQQKVSIRPVESLVNEKRKKKKKSSRARKGLNSAVPLSKENVRQESPKEALENDKDFGKESEAETSPEETLKSMNLTNISAVSEKERHCGPVQEMGEGITAPVSLLGEPHGVVAEPSAVLSVDSDSLLAMEKGENGGLKVGSEADAPEQAVASGGKKSKRVKKHKVGSAKGLNLPLVEESDNPKGDITPLISDAGVPVDDNIGAVLTDKTEVKEKGLPPKGDPELVSSSVQDEAEMNIKGAVVSSNPMDASDIIKMGDLSDKRKKRPKKTSKASVARSNTAGVKHVTSSEASVPLRFESDEAFDGDHPGHETKTEDDVLARTEKESILRIKDGGLGDGNIDTDQIDSAEKEEKGLSMYGDAKLMSSKEIDLKLKSSVRSEEEMSDKDMMVSSKLLDTSGVKEARVRGDKKKKLKKTKTSDATIGVSTSVENGDSARDVVPIRSELEKAFDSDYPGLEIKKEGKILSPGKTRTLKMKSINASSLGLEKEADKGSENEGTSLQLTQMTPFQEIADCREQKVKSESVKTKYSTSKSYPDPPIEQQVLSGDLTPSTEENKKEENGPSKKVKKSRLRKPTLEDKLSGSLPEVGKDSAIITESSQYQISRNNGSYQIPSDTPEHNVVERPLEENIEGDEYLVNGCTDVDNSHMEAPNVDVDGDELDFSQYFVPKPDHEVVTPVRGPVAQDIEIRASDKKLKANKKIKKVNKHSVGPVPDEQGILDSKENQGNNRKRDGVVSETVQGPLSKDERNKPAPQPKVEAFSDKVSRRKIVNESGTVTPVHAHRPRSSNTEISVDRVYNNEKKGRGGLQSHTDQYRMTVKRSSSNQMGEVLNNSNHEKSLLATSNTIFEDSSTESSQNEGELNNSVSSTQSPSPSSSEEDDTDLDSHGSYGRKRKDNGGNDVTMSQSKNMTLDMILRSSRSYKKAKLKATESQVEDPESQPEIVWDSQV